MYEVTSEIYKETNFELTKCKNGNLLSKFKFTVPPETEADFDLDGDFELARKKHAIIEIEHSGSTTLPLVGLQVWRGALLLADFLLYKRKEFANKQILELGAGCGLTSIVAAIYTKNVICTDVNIGGILELIKRNIDHNKSFFKNNIIKVMELNFKQEEFSTEMENIIENTDIVVAADVIYDDDLTDSFIKLLDKILNPKYRKRKTVYLALEKRYVFTVTDLDIMPPCYDYFLQKTLKKPWKFENIPINEFAQYFQYEKCKLLLLLKLTLK